jgi:hypothetical protein
VGAWGAGLLDNDGAWDLVQHLAGVDLDTRADHVARLLERTEAAAAGGVEGAAAWLDLDDATAGLTAALLVAMARSPGNFAEERARIVEHVARIADVGSFADLVGDLKRLRAAGLARSALHVVDAVATEAAGGAPTRSELAELWGDDAAWAAWVDHLRSALTRPTRRWTPTHERAARVLPIRRSVPPESALAIDLGNGQRGYGVYRTGSYLTCADVAQSVDQPPLSPARVALLPAAFTVFLMDYEDQPGGWTVLGRVPDPAALPPLPVTYMQNAGNPYDCQLIWPSWAKVVPATQQDCVGLGRAGVIYWPTQVEDRLRLHLAGQPNPRLEHERVRLSRSVFRVQPRPEGAAIRTPADLPMPWDDPAFHEFQPYCPLELVPTAAAAFGSNRTDLLAVEYDEAAFEILNREQRALDPDDSQSPTVTWMRRPAPVAILAVHDLPLTSDGSYATAHIRPRYTD